MKPNDALFSPSAAVAYELGEIGSELKSLCDKLDARDKRREAKRQRDLYEFKPWASGVPTVDAMGYRITFLDGGYGHDSRYWIGDVRENGAHMRFIPCKTFYGIAPTEAEAVAMCQAYGARRGLIQPHQTGKYVRPDGWVEMSFSSYSFR